MSTTAGEEAGPEGESEPAEEVAEVSVDGVAVTPAKFTLVDYDAEELAALTRSVADRVGLASGLLIRVEIDETTPLGRAEAISLDPLVLAMESGAVEHLHEPRQFDAERAEDVLGRLLMRVRDRLDPRFGEPPADLDMSLANSAAWDIYAVGRLDRAGLPAQKSRRRYHFRVRHGFSDHVDAIFNQLWEADDLTWADIERLSAEAAGDH